MHNSFFNSLYLTSLQASPYTVLRLPISPNLRKIYTHKISTCVYPLTGISRIFSNYASPLIILPWTGLKNRAPGRRALTKRADGEKIKLIPEPPPRCYPIAQKKQKPIARTQESPRETETRLSRESGCIPFSPGSPGTFRNVPKCIAVKRKRNVPK